MWDWERTPLLHVHLRTGTATATANPKLDAAYRALLGAAPVAGCPLDLPSGPTPTAATGAATWTVAGAGSCPDVSPELAAYAAQQRVYTLAADRGLLELSAASLRTHGVRSADVTIAADGACFGGRLQQRLFRTVVGYDAALLAWTSAHFPFSPARASLALADGDRNRGSPVNVHVRNGRTKAVSSVQQAAPQAGGFGAGPSLLSWLVFKAEAVASAVFLFFSASSLVSFTLRETQARMLRFTYLLQHQISHELPIAALVLTHSTESLMMVPVMVGVSEGVNG